MNENSKALEVEVNEEIVRLPKGSTLKDALEVTHTPYTDGTTIGIIKKIEKKEEITTEYRILTTKGELKIELMENSDSVKELRDIWFNSYNHFINKGVHYFSKDIVAFGPVKTDITPKRGEYKYEKWDFLFGAGGYDASNTYLILSKNRHIAAHGSPGVFAKITSGKNILMKLDKEDKINNIEPIIRLDAITDKLTTTDINTKLEDGMKIFTYFQAQLYPESPQGAEHFLAVVKNNIFSVDDISSAYLASKALIGEDCPYEQLGARNEGVITVRTEGSETGKVFISRTDRTSSPMHSVVGYVTKGLELIKLAESGEKLTIKTNPPRIMLLGKSFSEALKILNEYGIKLETSGYFGEDAIIVKQTPNTTIEIVKEGKVVAHGVKKDKLIEVELYDDLAPKTLDYFRHAIGLKNRPIGPLPIYATYANTILFRTQKRAEYKEITPENTPKTTVKAGEIGVTNQAAKSYGLIGVKLVDDSRFGPSGEKFVATNIIGRILDFEKLKEFKDGDIIYLREIK